jgi:uncharacterized protein YndB with AHSA1/START domain
MEQKTKVSAEDGKQEVFITREFDLPLELLFKACTEPDLVEQWMGTKVLKLESKKHGSYQFERKDDDGNIVFSANGVIHELIPDQKIIRTFEIENTPFGVQLEFIEFERLTETTSKLHIRTIYESIEQRNQLLQLPFAQGLNMAHNRLEDLANKLKNKPYEKKK